MWCLASQSEVGRSYRGKGRCFATLSTHRRNQVDDGGLVRMGATAKVVPRVAVGSRAECVCQEEKEGVL